MVWKRAVVLLCAVAGVGVAALPAAAGPAFTVADLGTQCASTVDGSGFGSVTVSTPTEVTGTGALPVPCQINVKADLTFTDATVTSGHLRLADSGGDPASLNVTRSHFAGTPGSGFAVQFTDTEDRVQVTESAFDYDASVWFGVAGADGGGAVSMVDTTLTSNGVHSQGVQIVAGETNGGRLDLTNVIATGPGQNFMFAGYCGLRDPIGLVMGCLDSGPVISPTTTTTTSSTTSTTPAAPTTTTAPASAPTTAAQTTTPSTATQNPAGVGDASGSPAPPGVSPPPPTTTSSGALPVTGGQVAGLLLVGVLLLGAGVAALTVKRRLRTTGDDQ